MKIVLLCLFCFMGGFAYSSMYSYVDNIDHCVSYRTGNTHWIGYRAISEDNTRRCFWLEDRFPYRIKQGVERV